jgi:hypothetical protein
MHPQEASKMTQKWHKKWHKRKSGTCAEKSHHDEHSPVAFPCLSIHLADLKAKPDANHANARPINDWSCQICSQYLAMSSARGSGFKPTPPGQISRELALLINGQISRDIDMQVLFEGLI